jgi:hypothetical protein
MTCLSIGLFAVVVAIIPVLTLLAIVGEYLRVRGLRRAAERLGLTFAAEGDPETVKQMERFSLFPPAPSRAVHNLLRGRYRQVEVKLFDFQFSTNCGEGWATWRQTVLLLRPPADSGLFAGPASGPAEVQAAGPRGGAERAAPRSPGLDLFPGGGDDTPQLSAEDEVRLFHRARFVLCTEARGGWLLICRKLERVDPEAIESFLEEGLQALARRQARAESGD